MLNNTEQKPGRLRTGQPPALVRRLLRAKRRMNAASHEAWPVARRGR
jgi:hypothetical protein